VSARLGLHCICPRNSMPGQAGQNGAIRVSPVDQRGRPISPRVLTAAEAVSRRAIFHAQKLMIDPAVAANLLEETAAAVSRVLESNNSDRNSIRDLESYLFRAFLRRLNRIKKQELLTAQVFSPQAFLSRISYDPRRTLEMKILADELLMQFSPMMRDFFCRHTVLSSWRDVGRVYGISAHAAESKFSQALQNVKKKLGLK
jgi:hypothetical protein